MSDDERCPTCGSEPDDTTLHRTGCVRIGTCGQFGPPWIDKPWHEHSDTDDLVDHYRKMHGSN